MIVGSLLTSIICAFLSSTITIHDIEIIFNIRPIIIFGMSHSWKAADGASDLEPIVEPP